MSLLALAFAFVAHAQSYPKLFFSYSSLYDANCPAEMRPSPAAVEEILTRTGEFAAAWQAQGPALMAALFNLTGKGFSRSELTATLSGCRDLPSISDPLVLNVTRYLRIERGARARNLDQFVDLVFHEMLHTWVGENLPRQTQLLHKYADESRLVRSHLHLMALQVMVYRRAGRTDLLSWIEVFYPSMSGEYPRAWEIVQVEGAEAFFAELP